MKRLLPFFLLLTYATLYAEPVTDPVGGYLAPPVNFHKYSIGHLKSSTLPTKYDSRDYGLITTSRNQVISGTCWAFATCDAIEASFTKSGNNPGWLAPQVFANCHEGHLWSKGKGGNGQIASAMVARLRGPVQEAGAPYVALETECPDYSDDYIPGHSPESLILPENDLEAIKECIYNYGAVSASMYYEGTYYNSATNTYCYTGTSNANHSISLIGWDDDERVFIAKFNYGANRFVNGCMKISYDDTLIATACYAFPSFIPKADIEKAYGYDITGETGTYYFTPVNSLSGICYFNTNGEDELLEYAGSYSTEPNETLTFSVLSDGTVYTKEITCKYPGFHVVRFDIPIPVKDLFLVAVDYSSKVIPIESKVDGYNEPVFIPVGSQYIQCNDDPAHEIPVGIDAPNCNDFNLCIKAYTRKPTPTIATDEKAGKETPAVINGRINPDIWNYAETIDIYTLDGRLVQHLTQNSLVNSKGLLIFVVGNSEGYKSSLEILK